MAWVEHRTSKLGVESFRAAYKGPDGRTIKGPWRPSSTEAKADAGDATVDMRRGDWTDPRAAGTTLTSVAAAWLATVDVRPKTMRSYRYQLESNILPVLGDQPVGNIVPSTIRTWLAGLARDDQLSPATIRTAHSVLRIVLEVAVADGRIRSNPARNRACRPPAATPREVIPLHPEQMDALIERVDERYRAMVAIAGYMGCRFGELAGLRRRRVDMLRRRISIVEQVTETGSTISFGPPKTKAGTRTIVIPRAIAPMIEHHLATYGAPGPDALVFPSPMGGPLRYSNFVDRFWDPAANPGRPERTKGMTFHELRHCAASLAIASGSDVKEIQAQLGIASAAVVLDIYGHLMPDRSDAIADRVSDAIEARRRTSG